jgi:hypothetical protein
LLPEEMFYSMAAKHLHCFAAIDWLILAALKMWIMIMLKIGAIIYFA